MVLPAVELQYSLFPVRLPGAALMSEHNALIPLAKMDGRMDTRGTEEAREETYD